MLIIKYFALLCASLAFGDMFLIPEDPFAVKYEKASDIVMGEITEITDADTQIPEFQEFRAGEVKKAKLKIKKSWKGQRAGIIEFYFVRPKFSPKDMDKMAKTSGPLKKNGLIIAFVRDVSGSKLAQRKFGISRETKGVKIEDKKAYKALEMVSKGGSLSEAAKIADER